MTTLADLFVPLAPDAGTAAPETGSRAPGRGRVALSAVGDSGARSSAAGCAALDRGGREEMGRGLST